jgi:hypothetical protein
MVDERLFDGLPRQPIPLRHSQIARNHVEIPELATVDAADLLDKPYTEPRFIVRSLAPLAGTVLLTGDTGSCKTAFMVHMMVCIATQTTVAGRFDVELNDPRPQLYLNGEMGSDLMRRYLQQAAAGLGVNIKRGRILFEGNDGVAAFRYNEGGAQQQLRTLIELHRPSVVYFDTQRALIGVDENETGAVRNVCRWLQYLSDEFQHVNIISHHLRKIGAVSNSGRERVAGSRDWIAGVDVHLEAKSREGRAMHSLTIGKTRMPTVDAVAGTEWPIEARLELFATPPRSIIIAGEPLNGPDTQPVIDAVDELRDRLEVEGPLSLEAMGARSGKAKRAYDEMRKSGEVIEVGKEGRKTLHGLAGVHDAPELLANGVKGADPTRDPTRSKSNNHKGSNGVTHRPHSRPQGIPSTELTAAHPCAGGTSVPPNERVGSGSALYSDPVRDPTRSLPSDGPESGPLEERL